MSKPIERVEIITGIDRRPRYTPAEKVRLPDREDELPRPGAEGVEGGGGHGGQDSARRRRNLLTNSRGSIGHIG